MFTQLTIDGIKKLVTIIIENKDRESHPEDWLHGFKQGKIPEDINFDKSQFNFLTITSEDFVQYHNCLKSLVSERGLENFSENIIEKELWHLTCEIYFESNELKNPIQLNKKLESFQSRLLAQTRPIVKYDVLIPVENIDVDKYEFQMAGVKFFKMTPELAISWGFIKEKPLYQTYYDQIINKTFGLISEDGADPVKVAERAKERLITALNMLRVGLLIDHEPRIIGWKILDEHMLFRCGEITLVKKHGENEPVFPGWHREFKSLVLKIDDNYYKQLIMSEDIIESLYSKNLIKGKIRDRVIRSMEWISKSTIREKFDDKVIDLCTALETLLTTKDDKKKGEFITLRMILLNMVLDRPFFSPAYTMYFYLKRSDLIHGSDINICTESDYSKCQWIVLDTLNKVLSYIQKFNLTQHIDFIRSLQNDPKLVHKAADYCKDFPEYYVDIDKAAQEIISNARSTN